MQFIHGIITTMDGMASNFQSQVASHQRHAMLVLAAVCAVLPLDNSHFVTLLLGAVAFILLQQLQPEVERRQPLSRKGCKVARVPTFGRCSKVPPCNPVVRACGNHPKSNTTQFPKTLPDGAAAAAPSAENGDAACMIETFKPEVRKPSALPVVAPTFKSLDWEAQVRELLEQITPTDEADTAVARIANTVKRAISQILPEADVTGFATSSLAGRQAFGVAVPEADIVISISPAVLSSRLQGRWAPGRNGGPPDLHKLHKSAVRACTDRLVTLSVLKFRRSAFRESEPKVTMMAPPGPGTGGQGVPVSISVNSLKPFHNAALLTECGQIQPCAKELILLVRRWAKDRGLCHAAKGHLPPYVWTLLTVFYLQAGKENGQSLLPPLDQFRSCSSLLKNKVRAPPGLARQRCEAIAQSSEQAGALFKDFVFFYNERFQWTGELASVRLGCRSAITGRSFSQEPGPNIEDPFDEGCNLAEGMTAASLARLHEELSRAQKLCSDPDASLSELLEPWAPPEQHADGDQVKEDLE